MGWMYRILWDEWWVIREIWLFFAKIGIWGVMGFIVIIATAEHTVKIIWPWLFRKEICVPLLDCYYKWIYKTFLRLLGPVWTLTPKELALFLALILSLLREWCVTGLCSRVWAPQTPLLASLRENSFPFEASLIVSQVYWYARLVSSVYLQVYTVLPSKLSCNSAKK